MSPKGSISNFNLHNKFQVNVSIKRAKSGKRRLIRARDGTFLGSPGHSDPDEIIYAKDAQIISPVASPEPVNYSVQNPVQNLVQNAGFQTNMAVAAVASSNSNTGMSSPVGYASNGANLIKDDGSNQSSEIVKSKGKIFVAAQNLSIFLMVVFAD